MFQSGTTQVQAKKWSLWTILLIGMVVLETILVSLALVPPVVDAHSAGFE